MSTRPRVTVSGIWTLNRRRTTAFFLIYVELKKSTGSELSILFRLQSAVVFKMPISLGDLLGAARSRHWCPRLIDKIKVHDSTGPLLSYRYRSKRTATFLFMYVGLKNQQIRN